MKKWFWILLSIVIVFFDQWSKYWAVKTLIPYKPESLLPMINFTLAYNTGAAFNFLHNTGMWHRWFLASFSFIVSIFLVIWLVRLPPNTKLQSLGISLILGGAVGNLYDRVFIGQVVDFVSLYYKNYYWPIFNLADAAICIGAVILLFGSWCSSRIFYEE